jgi:hypothetical protein
LLGDENLDELEGAVGKRADLELGERWGSIRPTGEEADEQLDRTEQDGWIKRCCGWIWMER